MPIANQQRRDISEWNVVEASKVEAKVACACLPPAWADPGVLVQPHAGVVPEPGDAQLVEASPALFCGELHPGEPSVGIGLLGEGLRRLVPPGLVVEIRRLPSSRRQLTYGAEASARHHAVASLLNRLAAAGSTRPAVIKASRSCRAMRTCRPTWWKTILRSAISRRMKRGGVFKQRPPHPL